MTHARRIARRGGLRRARRLRSPSIPSRLRRFLLAERLEERSLLAADFPGYHNIALPTDVNNDGHVSPIDALILFNALNQNGSYSLPQSAAAGESSAYKMYLDVNNDSYLSPIDALLVINRLNGEGELSQTDFIQFELRILRPGTDDILSGLVGTTLQTGTVSIGDEFDLQFLATDLRLEADPAGVFAAYTDIIFNNASLFNVQVSEIQTLRFGAPATWTGIGTFTLTVTLPGQSPQTTAPINIRTGGSPTGTALAADIIRTNIQTALDNLLGPGRTLVDFAAPGRVTTERTYDVRFTGNLANIDIPTMTTSLTTTQLSVVQELNPDTPAAFTEAFRSILLPNAPSSASAYQASLSAALVGSRFDDVGATSQQQAPTGAGEAKEIARVRLKATAEGALTFMATHDLPSVLHPGHDALVYGPSGSIPEALPIALVALGFPVRVEGSVSSATATTITPTFSDPLNVLGKFPIVGSDTNPTNPDRLVFTGGDLSGQEFTIASYNSSTNTLTVAGSGFGTTPPAQGDTFRIIAANDFVGTEPTQVTLNIVSGPISAVNDTATTNEDVAVTIDVLANDTTFPAGGTKRIVSVTQPTTGGSVAINATNDRVIFTPAADINGTFTFTYTARNITAGPTSQTSTATVTVTVNAINDPPTLNAIPSQNIDPGGTLTVNLSGIAAGPPTAVAFDEGNQTLTVEAVSSNPSNIAVTAVNYTSPQATGSIVLSHSPGAGGATITVTVRDNGTPPASFQRTFVVSPGNIAPVNTVPGTQTTPVNTPLAFNTANGNAISVADADAGTANIRTTLAVTSGRLNVGGSGGTVTGNGTATLTIEGPQATINARLQTLVFTPATGFTGQVTLTITTNDLGNTGPGGPQQDQDTVVINVGVVLPQANPDTFDATEDTTLTVNAPGVLANDNDDLAPTPRLPLSAVLVDNVPTAAGSVTLNSDGSFSYSPAANFFGTTSFTYRARTNDGVLSAPARVTINVAGTPDDPTAVDDDLIAVRLIDPTFANQELDVLANDFDVDNQPPSNAGLTVTAVGPTSLPGTSVRVENGKVIYSPTATTGTDSFSYTITDPTGRTATAIARVQVVDFVPKDVRGTVHFDSNGNGALDSGETRLAGVTIRLTGTDFSGAAVNLTTKTDTNGNYAFTALRPPQAGTRYTLEEVQPLFLLDGAEHNSTSNSLAIIPTGSNDRFSLSWDIPDRSGPITGLNFAERGVNVADPNLTNTAGLLTELNGSSSQNGFIMAVQTTGDPADSTIWSFALKGWDSSAVQSLRVLLNPNDLTTATLVINGTTQIRIYTDPNRNNGTLSDGTVTPSNGSMARFRILASGTNGTYIIRLDGTAAEFGFLAAATGQTPSPSGEGESVADPDFARAADEVFARQAWA